MPNLQTAEFIKQNHLLAALPETIFERILPQMQLVQLERGQVISSPHEFITNLYFPITALLSWLAITQAGERVEVGMAGKEGVIGIGSLLQDNNLPYEIEVEHPGIAVILNAAIFRAEFEQSLAVQKLFLYYIHTTLVQLAQSAACNRFHTAESRLCRWLLTASDRLQTNTLSLTQDTIAGMIGSGRPTVTLVVGTLQTAGLIQAKRGEITLLDREGLEAATCECYSIIKQSFDRFLSRTAL
jgi:CRP-like cAMP-binding protein